MKRMKRYEFVRRFPEVEQNQRINYSLCARSPFDAP